MIEKPSCGTCHLYFSTDMLYVLMLYDSSKLTAELFIPKIVFLFDAESLISRKCFSR